MRWIGGVLMSLALVTGGAAEAEEKLVGTIPELSALVKRTCRDQRLEGLGVVVTVRFSLRADGSLMGPPAVISVIAPRGYRAEPELLKQEVDAAMRSCTPLPLSADLGRALAGRLLQHRLGAVLGGAKPAPAKEI